MIIPIKFGIMKAISIQVYLAGIGSQAPRDRIHEGVASWAVEPDIFPADHLKRSKQQNQSFDP